MSDTATLSGVTNDAGGHIIFQLFGPGDLGTCSVLVFTSEEIPVNGPGDYDSGPYQPIVAGHYEWLATYSGDPNNSGASHACGLEPVTVEPPAALPSMRVESGYMPARGGRDPPFVGLPVRVDLDTYLTSFTLTLQDAYASGSMHTFTAPRTFRANGVTFRFHHWQDETGMRVSSKNSFKYPLQPGKTLTAVYTVPTIALTVYVYDAATRKPIAGASVYDNDGTTETLRGVTNSRGRLVVRIVPDPFNAHTLRITSTGHGDYTLPIGLLTRSRAVRVYIT